MRVEFDEHVATVTLARPEKHNAIDPEMLEALTAAGDRLAGRPEVRAVVLQGSGPSFCSGLDLPAFLGRGGAGAEAEADARGVLDRLREALKEPPPNRFQRAACVWLDLPVPVIAAIHGNCLGGGLQIALAADIRMAAADATLSVMELRWGLVPDMGITRTLPRLVGIDVAKELTYTARLLDGHEAARLGLVTRIAEDPRTAARELAREIAARSPDAVRRAKRLFDRGWHGTARETLALEASLQSELLGTHNQLAAMAAAMTGERPDFTDREQAAGQGLEP